MMKRNRGMTLTETMYAVFLTAASAGILLAAMPTAAMAYGTASDEHRAANLAQKEMESIRNLGYSNITPAQLLSAGLIDSASTVSTNTYTFSQCDSANHDNAAAVLQSGQATVRIDQTAQNLVKVTIVISWLSHGNSDSYELTTLVANV